MTRVIGDGRVKLKLLAARLKTADPLLRKELRRGFRAAAAPVVTRAQESIMAMPSHQPAPHLRAEIARTVGASTGLSRAGVRLEVVSQGRKMPRGRESLPAHTDSGRGWFHPVYARGPRPGWTWTGPQVGRPGWFEGAASVGRPAARNACQDAIDAVERHLSV